MKVLGEHRNSAQALPPAASVECGLAALYLMFGLFPSRFFLMLPLRLAGLTGRLSLWGLLPLSQISESTGTHFPSYLWSWFLSLKLIGCIHSWTEYPLWAWFIANTGQADEKFSSLLSSDLSNWQTYQKASNNIITQELFLMAIYTNYYLVGFPGGSVVKNLSAMQETQVWFLRWEDSPGEGNGNPLQHSCLGNPMNRRAWQVTVHGVAKESAWLSG